MLCTSCTLQVHDVPDYTAVQLVYSNTCTLLCCCNLGKAVQSLLSICLVLVCNAATHLCVVLLWQPKSRVQCQDNAQVHHLTLDMFRHT